MANGDERQPIIGPWSFCRSQNLEIQLSTRRPIVSRGSAIVSRRLQHVRVRVLVHVRVAGYNVEAVPILLPSVLILIIIIIVIHHHHPSPRTTDWWNLSPTYLIPIGLPSFILFFFDASRRQMKNQEADRSSAGDLCFFNLGCKYPGVGFPKRSSRTRGLSNDRLRWKTSNPSARLLSVFWWANWFLARDTGLGMSQASWEKNDAD